MNERRRGLGRGLGALIPSAPPGGERPSDVYFAQRADERSTTTEQPRTDATSPADSSPGGAEGGRPAAAGSTGNTDADDGPAQFEHPQTPGVDGSTGNAGATSTTDGGLVEVPGATFADVLVDEIEPNPRQPRQVFDEDELAELEHSIREIGVLQPIVLRPGTGAGARYELVMGERRWRASRRAGLTRVPAIIRGTSDDALLRDALLENLHRSELNPLEEAAAYGQLLEDFGCTHDDLAQRIGRSRPQISNTLRLLKLPPLVQRRVAAGVLSAGHARALLGLGDQAAMERLAQRIVAEGLSVRTTEELVTLGGEATPVRRRARGGSADPAMAELAGRLSDRLDTRVTISMGQRKGRMTVDFAGAEDLDRILQVLSADGAATERP